MTATNRTVLVTGAAGFIGGRLAALMASSGWKVTAIDVRPAPALPSGVDFTRTSCADADVLAAVRGGRYRAVVHQAGISNTLEPDWNRLKEHNVDQPLALARACASSRTTFVYASSFSVYGRSAREAVRESAEHDETVSGPLNHYARSKLLLDQRMRDLDTPPAAWAGLRYTNVFGVGEPLEGRASSIIAQILQAVASGRPIRIFSDTLTAGRDYVPVSRIHQFVESFLAAPTVVPSGVYNLGSGLAVTFAQLLDWATGFHGGGPVAVQLVANPIADRYQYWTQADNSAVAAHLPALGTMDRREILRHARECFEFYADHPIAAS